MASTTSEITFKNFVGYGMGSDQLNKNFVEVFAQMPGLVWIVARDRTFHFVNDNQKIQIGFNPYGLPLHKVLSPPSASTLLKILDQVEACGKTVELRESPFEFQGCVRFFNLTVTPLANLPGFTNGFFILGTDVSPLVQEKTGLKRSEERLAFGLRAAKMGIYEIDLPDLNARVTPEAEKIFGHEGLSGNFVESLLRIVHPDDIPQVMQGAISALQSGQPCNQIFRVVKSDGSTTWVQTQGDAYRGQGETPVRFYAVVQDVSERKRAEDDLKTAKEAAERANELKSSFLANMSHEIRTPLGAILGFTELMKAQDIGDSEKLSYLEIISRNGRQLTTIINDILDLSKINAGELTVEVLRCSPRKIIDEVISLFAGQAREKGLELRSRFEPDFPDWIGTDPTRLRQILLNVLGNALKFTLQGSVTIRSGSNGEPNEAGRFFIEVEDTGIGIPEQQKARLFKEFTQADESMTRKFGGTGLGLALSKRLAQALGGDVRLVRSETGFGSLFRIEIADRLSEASKERKRPAKAIPL